MKRMALERTQLPSPGGRPSTTRPTNSYVPATICHPARTDSKSPSFPRRARRRPPWGPVSLAQEMDTRGPAASLQQEL